MNPVARFISRPASEDPTKPEMGLVFFFKGNTALKAGRVYEIQDWDGELVIKDVGECVLGMSMSESHPKLGGKGCWHADINWLLECVGKLLCLTRKELDNVK